MKIGYTFTHTDAKLDDYFVKNNYIKIDTRNLNGCSIGNLNSIYNEFCGMYWLWHNQPFPEDNDWIEFSHYRRHLSIPCELEDNKTYAHSMHLGISIRDQYAKCHSLADLTTYGKVLLDDNVVSNELFSKFLNDKDFYCCNLLCIQGKAYKRYCEFMTKCFDKLEYCLKNKLISIEDRNAYQRRVGGFLLERMTGFWLKYMSNCEIANVKMIELNIPNLENSIR